MFHLDRFEEMQPRGAALEARRILVATDLGVASEEAIRAADAWADLRGSELLACHVGVRLECGTSILPQPPEAAPDPDPLTALDRSMVRQQLRSVLGRRGMGVPVYIASGEPGPGIAAVAQALRAFTVDARFGVHAGTCSVLVVRPVRATA